MAGAREFVRVSRTGKPDDLFNSLIGGFGSGAILGRLQGTKSLLLYLGSPMERGATSSLLSCVMLVSESNQ